MPCAAAGGIAIAFARFIMMSSTIGRDVVNEMLAGWLLRVDGDCQIATKGVENTNIVVRDGGGAARWVLRRYRSSSFAGARREADILLHLRARGFPVPKILPDRYGDHVASVGGDPATLLSFMPGRDLEDLPAGALPVELAREIGALLGRLDVALAELPAVETGPPPAHELTNLETTRRRFATCAGHGGVPWTLVRERLRDLERHAQAGAWRALPRQLVHGDVSGQNLLADGGRRRITGLIDFGDAVPSVRVADIAVAICHLGFARGTAGRPWPVRRRRSAPPSVRCSNRASSSWWWTTSGASCTAATIPATRR
jgi:Ser/Thr protein kinase RdoA (MazF antagonist)